MKLIPCNPAKGKAFSGMTDDELARHIEYEFPDLLGSLIAFKSVCLVLKIALMKKSRLTRNRSMVMMQTLFIVTPETCLNSN